MNEELAKFITKELSKNHNRKHIVQRVCERSGLPWKQAEQFVVLIEAKYRRATLPQQAPMLLFLSIGILLLGIGLLAFNGQILFGFVQNGVLEQALRLQSDTYRTLGLLAGFGMTVAGLIGLWNAIGTIFPQ